MAPEKKRLHNLRTNKVPVTSAMIMRLQFAPLQKHLKLKKTFYKD